MPNEWVFRIKRIRLINFHNFTNELVEVNNGGHLFLLGDNGSGKTTLLDAIHLVLTAGEDVEFNAAARVAGSSRDGRRLQGIILRQNIESPAPLNPQGGITYAALEIEGRQGKPVCLTLGMEAHGVDDQVRYWGAVRTGALEDLPLLVEQDGCQFPASRRVFRDHLDGSGFCPDLKSYRQELVRRLYGGSEDLFKESCRLLRMGKAYREIAAGTGDYHELFKKLLPDPKRDLFERVIRTLRELDQSINDLSGLEERQSYLEILAAFVREIDRARETTLRYKWLIHHMRAEHLANEASRCEQARLSAETELTQCREQAARDRDMLAELDRKLNVLRGADSSGLLMLEKERNNELRRLEDERKRREDAAKQSSINRTEAEKAFRDTELNRLEGLSRLYAELNRLRADLPFSISILLGEMDAMQRIEDVREVGDISMETASNQARQELEALASEMSQKELRLNSLRTDLESLEREIAQLTAQEEITPSVPGFQEAVSSLNQRMITPRALYEDLEWKPGLSEETKSAIEETIGHEVLGILMLPAADYDSAADAVFGNCPGVRLANRDETRDDPPAWIRESFDISRSDPTAIRILAEEMRARMDPSVDRRNGNPVLSFRSHERRLYGPPATLIGVERRREAMRTRLKELSVERTGVERDIRISEKDIKAISARRDILNKFSGLLWAGQSETSRNLSNSLAARERLDAAERELAAQKTALDETANKHQSCRDQLADLRAQISQKGLDKL